MTINLRFARNSKISRFSKIRKNKPHGGLIGGFTVPRFQPTSEELERVVIEWDVETAAPAAVVGVAFAHAIEAVAAEEVAARQLHLRLGLTGLPSKVHTYLLVRMVWCTKYYWPQTNEEFCKIRKILTKIQDPIIILHVLFCTI